MTATILAIDLGKYKSVACAYRAGCEPSFSSLASNPEAFLRLCQRHRPGVVVIEAGLLAGWQTPGRPGKSNRRTGCRGIWQPPAATPRFAGCDR